MMTVEPKASTTIVWLRQLTTGTFTTINNKMDNIDLLHRNKKTLVVLLLVWIVLIVGGGGTFSIFVSKKVARFLYDNAAAVQRLADESGPVLLEGDVLGLSRKVTAFINAQDAIFTAILDHENKVMAHSDPQQLNRSIQPLTNEKAYGNVNEVMIRTGQMNDNVQVVTFTGAITFSGIQIGSAIFGLPLSQLESIKHRYRLPKIFYIIACTLGIIVLFIMLDRHRQKLPKKTKTSDTMDGATIGPYRLRERIAQGGMAELYKADYVREDGFRRTLAVKRVLPHLSENQDFIKMFVREARLAAILQHPNIVQIFDFGKIQNAYFIAMEYIDGMNLGQIMATLKTGLPVNMAIFIAIKISVGLDYSHNRKDDETGQPLGIVHRDISPQNILVSFQGEVKISDFGISKANTEPSLTQAGVIKGKMGYLSPEQALGQTVDHQCDIYSLGLVLYEILTASRVYQFDTDIEAIRTIPEMEITPLIEVRPDIPNGLHQIVMKCLEKDKKLRYADARELHDDLTQLKGKLQIPYDASDLSNFMRTTFEHA